MKCFGLIVGLLLLAMPVTAQEELNVQSVATYACYEVYPCDTTAFQIYIKKDEAEDWVDAHGNGDYTMLGDWCNGPENNTLECVSWTTLKSAIDNEDIAYRECNAEGGDSIYTPLPALNFKSCTKCREAVWGGKSRSVKFVNFFAF